MGQPGVFGSSPISAAAFHSSLGHGSLIVLAVLVLLPAAAIIARRWQGARQGAPEPPEAAGRRLVRVAFGILWLVDGLLQMQPAMPLGLPSQVVAPASAGSPAWLLHATSWFSTVWLEHPIASASAAVWVQLGIGAWLLVAPQGRWSRAGGAISAAWAAGVWVLGEALGGLLAPGAGFLFGAPGAAFFYLLAGVLLALPGTAWATPALGRRLLRGLAALLGALALLQAWPGRGSWSGKGGTLVSMLDQMRHVSQPAALSSLLGAVAHLAGDFPVEINLAVVVTMLAVAAGLATGRKGPAFAGLVGLSALAALTWVAVQDLGVLGGTGTDPNSMPPLVALAVAGYLALTRQPSTEPAAAPTGLSLARGMLTAVAAAALLVGGVPAIAAAASPPSTFTANAVSGGVQALDQPLPPVTLEDQYGKPVSLSSLRGKALLIAFLDPVCSAECPVIAQEMRQAGAMLGTADRHVELVAVVDNPIYRAPSLIRTFDSVEHLSGVGNWMFLTGSTPALRQVWSRFGVGVGLGGPGTMVVHSDVAYLVDPAGIVRATLDPDPGVYTTPYTGSFASLLASQLRKVLTPA